jgi:hypothetical protein
MTLSHKLAGYASFIAWLPVTGTGLLISFSILVFLGLPAAVIGSALLVCSIRAAAGSRPALWAVVLGALTILAWTLIPVLFVAHSTPDGTAGWTAWTCETLLALIAFSAAAHSLTQRPSRVFVS